MLLLAHHGSVHLLTVKGNSLLLLLLSALTEVCVAPAPRHLSADAKVAIEHPHGVGRAPSASLLLLLLLHLVLMVLVRGGRGQAALGHGRDAAADDAVVMRRRDGARGGNVLSLLLQPGEVTGDATAATGTDQAGTVVATTYEAGPPAGTGRHGPDYVTPGPGRVAHGRRGEV